MIKLTNSEEKVGEFFILIGIFLIINGFIDWLNLNYQEMILSGLIVLWIGVSKIIKLRKKDKKNGR